MAVPVDVYFCSFEVFSGILVAKMSVSLESDESTMEQDWQEKRRFSFAEADWIIWRYWGTSLITQNSFLPHSCCSC